MSHAHSVTGRPACCRQRPFAPAAPLLPYPDSKPSAGPRGRASRPGTCSCSCISTRSRPLTISVMPCSTWRRRVQAPEAGQTLPDAACRKCQHPKPHSDAEVFPHGVHTLWASPVKCSAGCVPLHKAAPCKGRDADDTARDMLLAVTAASPAPRRQRCQPRRRAPTWTRQGGRGLARSRRSQAQAGRVGCA